MVLGVAAALVQLTVLALTVHDVDIEQSQHSLSCDIA